MQLSRCAPAAQARRARPVALSCSTSAYLGRSILPVRTLGEHAAASMPEWPSFWWSGARRGSGGGRNPSLPALPPLLLLLLAQPQCGAHLACRLATAAGAARSTPRRCASAGFFPGRGSTRGHPCGRGGAGGVWSQGPGAGEEASGAGCSRGRREVACKSAALPLSMDVQHCRCAMCCAALSYSVLCAPHGSPTLTGVLLRRPRAWAPRCARLRPPFGRSLRCLRS